VHCGQTVGRIKTKLGVQVGLGPGHIVLDGDPAPLPQRGTAPTQFLAHICCCQMAAWINWGYTPIEMQKVVAMATSLKPRPHQQHIEATGNFDIRHVECYKLPVASICCWCGRGLMRSCFNHLFAGHVTQRIRSVCKLKNTVNGGLW